MSALVYIIFGAISCSFVVVECFTKNKIIKNICFIALLVFYFLLGVLKGDYVGTDSITYTKLYNETARDVSFLTFVKNGSPEYLYNGLLYIFSNIGLHKVFFDILMFGIITVCLYFTFRKVEKPILCLLIFYFAGFFGMSFTGIRQAVAISISSLAIYLYLFFDFKKKYVRLIVYYALIIASIGFHKTSFFLAAMPLLLMIPINNKNLLFISLLILPLSIMLPRMYLLFGVMMNEYYLPYTSRVSLTFLIIVILLFICSFSYFKSLNKFFEKIHFYAGEFNFINKAYYILLFTMAIFLSFNTVSMSVPRMAMYLYFPLSIYLATLANNFIDKRVRIIFVLVMEICFFVFFIKNLSTWGILPYEIRF